MVTSMITSMNTRMNISMNINVVVLIEIRSGSFEDGFPVILRILEEGRLIKEERNRPPIPPSPQIPQLYEEWQQQYNRLGQSRKIQPQESNSAEKFRKIQPVPDQVTQASVIQRCKSATEELEKQLRQWFQQDSFQSLRDRILSQKEIHRDNSIPIVIDAHTGNQQQDILLRKLPWHLWDLFDELRQAEVVLNAGFSRPIAPLPYPVKILAIFGSSEGGLELQSERVELGQLQQVGATITVLEQPERERLHDALCQSWDILFFAGHSFSQEQCQTGSIQISDGRSLSLNDLREDLRISISKGLKLAIFNSCDGLGIANYLASLQVQSMVVMREPVPDVIAREFLRYFLSEFASGKPLYLAVREARENLHWWESAENPCPAASWLPIVCQNPNQAELIWSTPIPTTTTTSTSIPTTTPILAAPSPSDNSMQRSRKRSDPPPIVFILLFFGLIAGGSWIFKNYLHQPTNPLRTQISTDVSNSLSFGEKLLIENTVTPDKQEGIQDFSQGNFADAITHWRQALQRTPNDPETLVYLNNAIAAQNAANNLGHLLKIAVSLPIGLDPEISKELLRGVAIAQTTANCGIKPMEQAIQDPQTSLNCQGRIDGNLLQIQLADDQGDVNAVVPIATALVDEPDILAVIGHYSSSVTQKAVTDVYNPRRLVVVSPTSTSVKLSGMSPYLFRASTSDAIAAQSLARYVSSQKLNRIAVAYVSGDAYSESLKNEFLRQFLGKSYVFECDLLKGGASFNADQCLNSASQQKAEALLLIPSTTDMVDRALRLVKQNNHSLQLLGGDTMYSLRTIKDFGEEAMKGKMVIAIPWHRHNSSLEENARELFGQVNISWRTAMAYDAAQAVITGLAENPTREGLRQALSRPNFRADGSTGQNTIQFDPQSGDRLPEKNIGVLVNVAPSANGTYSFQLQQ
jgi:branched-chain amino acid transport system substrate-binding protein